MIFNASEQEACRFLIPCMFGGKRSLNIYIYIYMPADAQSRFMNE